MIRSGQALFRDTSNKGLLTMNTTVKYALAILALLVMLAGVVVFADYDVTNNRLNMLPPTNPISGSPNLQQPQSF